jgi:hypothetical protein
MKHMRVMINEVNGKNNVAILGGGRPCIISSQIVNERDDADIVVNIWDERPRISCQSKTSSLKKTA